jgi:integrase
VPLKIYRRKGSTIWHYRGTLAGHRQRGTTGTSDKEAAQQIASKIETEYWKGRLDGPQEILTFPKAAALYLAAGKPSRFIASLVKYWGDAKVKDITPGAIRQSAIEIYPSHSNATRNRQVIVPTQAIINHCAELQLCLHLKVKRFKTDTKLKKPVTVEWLEQFCAHADRPDTAALAIFMFTTGARISEALAVEWEDIDLQARKVLIKQTKLGNQRRAHIPNRLLVALANLPRNRKPFAFAGHSSAVAAWERAVEAAGIAPLTFHSCRHGFATALLHQGVDIITIAKLGGWKSPAHVFQTYGHASDDDTLTDLIFGTETDTVPSKSKRNQSVG